METCPASGNALATYPIEEATGSKPVAPIHPLKMLYVVSSLYVSPLIYDLLVR